MTDHPVLAEQKYPGGVIPPAYLTRDSESPFGPDGIGGFLRRRNWTILCGFLATAASVGGVIYLLPARYESSVSFLVEAPNSQRSSEALEPLERLGQSRNAETEVELIQSRRVVEPVVDELDLHVELKSDRDDVRPGDVFTSFSAGPDALPGRYRLARSGNNYDVTEEESGRKVATGSPGSPIVFAGISATIPASNAFTDLSLNVIPFEQAVDSVRKRINAVAIQKQADVVRLTCREKRHAAHSVCALRSSVNT